MLAALPFLSYLTFVALLNHRGIDWRRAVVFASIPCAVFIALDTEGLSAFGLVTKMGLVCSWTVFAIFALLLLLKMSGNSNPSEAGSAEPTPNDGTGWLLLYRGSFAGIAALVAMIGITALACAPNTWDAMEYHLPRVFEWMNNGSVGLYPTIDRAQLAMPPWAEYAMLHLDLLFGGDRLVNLVQWSAYVGSIITVSLIAKELGGNRQSQMFAALICATIPSAVLGASGSKNDSVLAYWIVLSAYLLLTWRREQNWLHTIALGCTLALSVFTKGTAFAFLPFLMIAGALTWSGRARRKFALRLPVLAAIGLLVLAPFWVRNYTFSSSIFGPPFYEGLGPVDARMYANSHITVAGTVANVLRNVALHLGVPIDALNRQTTKVISSVIKSIGVDPNDPGQLVASQFGYVPPFSVQFGWRHEVIAGEPFHLLAFLAAFVVCSMSYRKFDRSVALLGLGILGGFVLYSALLRWGPWNARYQLSLFALAAPFTAVVFARTLPPRAIWAATAIFLLFALPLAVGNASRPLVTKHGFARSIFGISREEQYFLDQHIEMGSSFIEAARFATRNRCRSIGLDANLLRFEYPMLALLSQDGIPRRIVYTAVDNSTTRFASQNAPKLCLVVCLGCVNAAEKWHQYGIPRTKDHSFGDYVAVMPIESPPSNVVVGDGSLIPSAQ
jgi:hypothetical protein